MQVDYRKNPIRIIKIDNGVRLTLNFNAVSNGTNLSMCETYEWCRKFDPTEIVHKLAVVLDMSDDNFTNAKWVGNTGLEFDLETTDQYVKILTDLRQAPLEDTVYQATDDTFWCVNE